MEPTNEKLPLTGQQEQPKKPKRRKRKPSKWKTRLKQLGVLVFLAIFFLMAGYIIWERSDMTIPVQTKVPPPTRVADCIDKCRQACWSDKPTAAYVRPPPAGTNQMAFAQRAEEPKPPELQKKLDRPKAPKKPTKKPDAPSPKYEEKMLVASPLAKDDLGPQQPAEREKKEMCSSYFSNELPGVLPMRIEDYCGCVAKKFGQSIARLSTAEEIVTAWQAQKQACYGTRFTKAAAAEDRQFFRACESDRGKMFPAYARTQELRKSGFCACYGSGLSALGYNPNFKSDSVDATERTYQKCFVNYPPEL